MGAPQSSYNLVPAVALQGQVADPPLDGYIVSRAAQAALDCGLFVVDGTAITQCKVPALAADVTSKLVGVSLYQSMKMPTGSATHYKATEQVPVLRKGRIWVLVDSTSPGAIADGAVALFITNGTGAGTPGALQSTANTGLATAIPNGAAKVITGAAAGGICLVEINLP